MAKKKNTKTRRRTNKKTRHLLDTNINPDAAGIDVGAEELVAAVPAERSAEPVRTFSTFTSGLHELRDWLLEHGVKTVAMESTGNYWIAAYQILEDAGLEVVLTNARHIKAVPGKKTDVCDAQWIQQLHRAGLLRKSFRPDRGIVPFRYLMRHRAGLVEKGSTCLRRMQKVLTEMNLKLHHVFSDIDGASSLAIIDAILGGERDPEVLWKLRDKRCRTTKADFLAAVEGDLRPEYLFVLGQELAAWREVGRQVAECDAQVEVLLAGVAGVTDAAAPVPCKKIGHKNAPGFDVRAEAFRFYGVDLSTIDGVSTTTLAVLMSELGTGEQVLENFRSAGAFASWLGLCPDNRISGGKVLKSKTRPVANRVSAALRMCAFCLNNSKGKLGQFNRRMKGRLGKAEGITATAHKIARIIYGMIESRKPYDDAEAFKTNPISEAKRLRALEKAAKSLGMKLVAA